MSGMTKSLPIIGLLICLLVVAGCGYLQRHHAPTVEDVPQTFHAARESGSFDDVIWWTMFEDSVLERIINEAITDNLTIEQALARLDQFRAGRAAARSSLFPTVSAEGSYTKGESQFIPSQPPADVDYYQVRATASYEIDLWGRLHGQRGAAYADLIAGENDLRSILMTMTAQAAHTYYSVVELRAQQKLLEQTVASHEEYLDLVNDRYRSGIVPSLDVYQAQGNLAMSRAQKAQIDAALSAAEHALSTLLGDYPRHGWSVDFGELPQSVREIRPGLPSELVMRRPDVRAAYARLQAADLRWASANADRFPRFTLTGSGSNISEDLEDVLDPDDLLWNMIAGVMVPVFEGGRRKAEADRARGAYRELAAGYKAALLNAFREVEDALLQGRLQEERIAHLETQSEAARNSLRRATDQYLLGVSEYLPVLLAQTAHYNAQSSLLAARRELVGLRIDLATALGGAWTDDIVREFELTRKLHTEKH